jgi:hypothetical protein
MGFFDDLGRLMDVGAKQPRPGMRESMKKSADSAEAAQKFQAELAASTGAHGSLGANPFANAAAYTAAVPGSGTVLSLTDTGQLLADSHVYDIALTVTIDGREPFEVVHRQVLSAAVLGAWQPGKVIALRVDPVDQSKVMLG